MSLADSRRGRAAGVSGSPASEVTRCRFLLNAGSTRLFPQGLPGGLTVDLYGPLCFDVSLTELSGVPQLSYRGSVEPQDVHNLLLSYDALVLPSYREGYPGVVLEAYAAGLPVVVARWIGVQELVDDSTGVLVEPRDASALRGAMLSLVENAELYARLREGVRRTREQFSDEVWHERFLEYCRSLTRC